MAEGRYTLINKHSGKVIDVANFSSDNGAYINQWQNNLSANQQWDLTDLGNGYYSLIAAHSGKSLDVYGWNSENGAEARQWEYTAATNQQWQIEAQGNDYYRVTSRYSGKALDVSGSSLEDGGSIGFWDFHAGDNQLWGFQLVGSATPKHKTAFEITQDMGAGWNLGNSLDAHGGETNWGNPATSKAMIDQIRKAGFKTLRVPVTWDDNISGSEHTIATSWLDRVEEVINYGLDNDMYVIVNVHHDPTFWAEVTAENEANAFDHLTKFWAQIATRFNGYDQHLIFEVMNEPMVGDDWSGKAEYFTVINHLNAAALAVIRASGGNNNNRLVMLPGYTAGPWEDQITAITIPDDQMIAISVHAYLPYTFAMDRTGTAIYSDTATIDAMFSRLNNVFISKNIPVVIGEWGTVDKSNLAQRIKHATHYVQSAKTIGIPTIVWDNNLFNSTNGENFGLYHRTENYWPFSDLVDAIVTNAN